MYVDIDAEQPSITLLSVDMADTMYLENSGCSGSIKKGHPLQNRKPERITSTTARNTRAVKDNSRRPK